MISVIMPYWHRLPLLRDALYQLDHLYSGVDLEVIIADDGCELSLGDVSGYDLHIAVINLPRKVYAKNPCVPLNRAAEMARGEYLAITNPEIIHKTAVLEQMVDQVEESGSNHYCSAAVWSNDTKRWYNHSEKNIERTNRAPSPPCAGLHFLAVMRRDFFWSAGGFDESYRDGQGYEDNDFLWSLHVAGGTFSIRDDLVVDHYGTQVKWPSGGLKRNAEIFHKKWDVYIEGQKSKVHA